MIALMGKMLLYPVPQVRERKEEVGTSFYVHILIVLLSLTLIILSLSLSFFIPLYFHSFIYSFIVVRLCISSE